MMQKFFFDPYTRCVLLAASAALVLAHAPAALAGGPAADLESMLRRPAISFELAQDEDSPMSLDSEDGAAPRRWWPLLLSALVPGLGEATTGHWRGYPLIAADAGLLGAAVSKHGTGEDREREYKAFADANYSEEVWFEHVQGDIRNSSGADEFFDWECYDEKDCVPLYVSRQEDEREWYENIGKWSPFFFGWREYWRVSEGGEGFWPTSVAEMEAGTPTQQKYVEMRIASNDAYAARDNLINVSLLLRAFSIVQMAYLEGFVGGRFSAADANLEPGEFGFALDDGLSAFASSGPWSGSRVGVRMRF